MYEKLLGTMRTPSSHMNDGSRIYSTPEVHNNFPLCIVIFQAFFPLFLMLYAYLINH